MWLEQTESHIKISEPVDLTADKDNIEMKYQRFNELRADLIRCEPRVLSLQEAANQLLRDNDVPDSSHRTVTKLTELRLKLQSLKRLTSIYVIKLASVLGRDPNDLGVSLAAPSSSIGPLHSYNYDVSLINRCIIL